MSENFILFRNFPTLDQAKELEKLLNQNHIKTILTDNVAPVDILLSGSALQNQFEIKISSSDISKAESLFDEPAENILDEIDEDYYLFDFTNEELYEILLKSDEWNALDYKLAQKILTDRGKAIDSEMLNSLKKERLKLLAQPEGNQKPWIIAGYLFSFLGGGIGIIIGYSLWTAQKTLPNGQRVYSYNAKDRKNGMYIFIIGAIVFSATILTKILSMI